MEHTLECRTCGASFQPDAGLFACPECERGGTGRLEATIAPGSVDHDALPFGDSHDPDASMWRYRELLPLLGDDPVTIGEGWTPLIDAPRLQNGAGPEGTAGVDVRIKNETVNPTWSFKDRLNSLLVSNATAGGADRFAVSSTGNHGASTATYARRAGVDDVVVLLHPESERPARLQVRVTGADAVVTEAEARVELLAELVDRGWFPTTSIPGRYDWLPYGPEGYKTIAFEIVEQLPEPPAAVLVPTGSGDGLYGIWKGFRELRDLGVIDDAPRMAAVQTAELAPLVEAVESGRTDVRVEADAPPLTTSTASDSVPAHAVDALEESGGAVYAVSEDAIVDAMGATAADGVVLEPASALAPAGVGVAIEGGLVADGDTVVCVGTGAGVKWPDSLESVVGAVPTIGPDWEDLVAATSVRPEGPR